MDIANDKVLHFLVSAVLMAILKDFIPVVYAMLVAIAIGVGKELIWDLLLGKGKASVGDMVADLLGVLLTTVL